MRSIRCFTFLFLVFLAAASILPAQQPQAAVLATANGFTFRASDLSVEARRVFDQQGKLIEDNRRSVFDQWIFEELLNMEAKARGVAAEKIEAEAAAKAGKPTEVQIKAVYDGNRQSLGNRTLDDVRPNIIEYLTRQANVEQVTALFNSLKAKYKYTALKDVGSARIAAENIASIGTRQITIGEFERVNRIALHDYNAALNEEIRADLENTIYAALLNAEAKKRSTDSGSVLAVEITNKLKDYSDYERTKLEDELQAKLFRDYAVKLALPVIEPQVLSVSPDDDPSIGPATAKVTVIAFVDFQCSACAAFSPLMKQVIAEFGPSVRLVMRDFPLTQIHQHGMDAALAGYAARQQGKFFEMADLMYRNQEALDRSSLIKYAGELEINVVQFERDMQSAAAVAEVKKDIADGNSYGVSGTPSVFVNGVRLQRLSTARLRNMIQSAQK